MDFNFPTSGDYAMAEVQSSTREQRSLERRVEDLEQELKDLKEQLARTSGHN